MYNNCGAWFKTFGGSEILSPQHKNIAIEIFTLYKEEIEKGNNVLAAYITNDSKFLTRELSTSYHGYMNDLREDIEYTLEELEHNKIWYYVAEKENVGAANYDGVATIKEVRFEDLEVELFNKEISDNLNTTVVRRIFNDLLHEVDHSITPQGHASEFQATSSQFISTSSMTRMEELNHFLNGQDFTYSIERAYTETLLDVWLSSRPYAERDCQAQCIITFNDHLDDENLKEGLFWFDLSVENITTMISDMCNVRIIPRDANEAQVCERNEAIYQGINNLQCACEEFRVSDLEKITALMLRESGITNLAINDFRNFKNVTLMDLDGNELSELNDNLFSFLPSLDSLKINNNSLRNLHPLTFNNISNLRNLELDFNNLEVIETKQFINLGNLENLTISNNQLSEIENNAFIGLVNLKTLLLTHNKLETITPGTFDGLQNLEFLNLIANPISVLPENWWRGLVNIKEINLRSSRLSETDKIKVIDELKREFPNIILEI